MVYFLTEISYININYSQRKNPQEFIGFPFESIWSYINMDILYVDSPNSKWVSNMLYVRKTPKKP